MSDDRVGSPYGPLPSRYTCARLGDVCVAKGGVQTGPFGSQLHQRDYVATGTPIITVEHLGENRVSHQAVPRVTERDRARLAKYTLRSGDIVFSRVGSVDRRALVREKEAGWLFSGRCLRVRVRRDLIDPVFLSYFFGLPSFREYVRAIAYGATMPSLNTRLLSDLPVYFPSLPEQLVIAHVLGTLDDKIELNRRMNETLEAMARAIFKSWFVDFDPVRAKMAGRQPYGMDAEAAALFPDSFQESPVGAVPRGWTALPLDQVAEFINGLALQKYPPEGEEYLPVIKIAELRRGITNSSGRASPEIDRKYIVDDGDIILSWSGSLELRVWCGGKGALNQHLFKVVSERYPKSFYLEWVRQHLPGFRAIASGKATTMGHIQRHHLSEALVVVPPTQLVERAGQVMGPLLDLQIANQCESRALAATRDALLPKLLSGEIRLKDAEKFVELAT